jgi:hypothetical protein
LEQWVVLGSIKVSAQDSAVGYIGPLSAQQGIAEITDKYR